MPRLIIHCFRFDTCVKNPILIVTIPNFSGFLARLAKLSELGWAGIRQSAPHSFGMEPIPVRQMVYKSKLPDFVSSDADLHVFRAVGDNRSFVGLQVGKIFYIFFIEAKFNDIYPHGRRK